MINFQNPGDTPVIGPCGVVVMPGAIVSVEDGYALPRRVEGTSNRRPSVIEMLAPQLVPADDEGRARIAAEFAEDAVLAKRSAIAPQAVEALVQRGYSRGAAELIAANEARMAADAAGAKKVKR